MVRIAVPRSRDEAHSPLVFRLHGPGHRCHTLATDDLAGEILYKTTATAHVLDAAPDHLVGQYQGLYTGAATSGTMLAAPIGAAIYSLAPGLLWPLRGFILGLAGPTSPARQTRRQSLCMISNARTEKGKGGTCRSWKQATAGSGHWRQGIDRGHRTSWMREI